MVRMCELVLAGTRERVPCDALDAHAVRVELPAPPLGGATSCVRSDECPAGFFCDTVRAHPELDAGGGICVLARGREKDACTEDRQCLSQYRCSRQHCTLRDEYYSPR